MLLCKGVQSHTCSRVCVTTHAGYLIHVQGLKSLEVAHAAGVVMCYGSDLLGDLHPAQVGAELAYGLCNVRAYGTVRTRDEGPAPCTGTSAMVTYRSAGTGLQWCTDRTDCWGTCNPRTKAAGGRGAAAHLKWAGWLDSNTHWLCS